MKATKKKTRIASVRLITEAHEVWYERAAEAGLSTRAWLEKAILENKTQIIVKQKPHPELRPLLFQVNKAGNNINELAHHFNALKSANAITSAEYLAALDALAEIQLSLREAVDYAR